jgi:hypothetical protein
VFIGLARRLALPFGDGFGGNAKHLGRFLSREVEDVLDAKDIGALAGRVVGTPPVGQPVPSCAEHVYRLLEDAGKTVLLQDLRVRNLEGIVGFSQLAKSFRQHEPE